MNQRRVAKWATAQALPWMIYQRRAAALAEVRRRLAATAARRHHPAVPGERADLVRRLSTVEAVADAFQTLQRTAPTEVRAFDAPPYVSLDLAAPNHVEEEMLDRGVTYRIIYDRRGVDVPGRLAILLVGVGQGEHARVGDVPMKMLLTDELAALVGNVVGGRLASALLIREPVLPAALAELFESYWAHRSYYCLTPDGEDFIRILGEINRMYRRRRNHEE